MRNLHVIELTLIITLAEVHAKKASKFVFEGDGEEDVQEFKRDDADEGSDNEEEQDDAAEDDDGPEDDFNAAWEVLDLARALYEKKGDSDEIRLKVADTYIALGDVSLETGMSICVGCYHYFLLTHFKYLNDRKVRPSHHRLQRRP